MLTCKHRFELMAPIVVPDVESHYAKTNVGRGAMGSAVVGVRPWHSRIGLRVKIFAACRSAPADCLEGYNDRQLISFSCDSLNAEMASGTGTVERNQALTSAGSETS